MSNPSLPPTPPTHPSSFLKGCPSDLFTWLRSTCIQDRVCCHQPPNVNILHMSKQLDERRRWKSYFPFQSHIALAAFTCIKELAPRIFSSCLQASTQLLNKPATAPKDLPKAALPDLPTHLRGDFLYSAIPWGWSQGSTELAHHGPHDHPPPPSSKAPSSRKSQPQI